MATKIATRHAYGDALAELGANPRVVAFDADVSTCTMSATFGGRYPERFFNCGIAEANMVCMAAGMSTFGYIPFVQLSVGEDGATHQCVEDLALMRAIPGMTVVCPADGPETAAAVQAIAAYKGPVYLRLGRLAVDTVTDIPGYSFTLGRAVKLREGKDVTLIATGLMVQEACKAAQLLEKEGISARVLDMHTIKPLDREAVLAAAEETGCIVTAEEHNILGGLGGAVAEVLIESRPTPMVRVGVRDCFGRSGSAQELLKLYHLDAADLVAAAKQAIQAKRA